ncbi:Glycine betaine transporter BetP [Corynebacterium cystitidis DSM 20524]|uniref:BCCT, betaine/carnitine/choline family transporter n=1 Tax=Corynebacterium cystitidis DSM 20524 TaxID=1121357 RepID=A0A1H9TU34_9CORY|nr:Glycine betaine transporter BetP [Corynebacterium cystitidis DSM 20524]SES00715.1 BCCT, betaine/carnitine/choline family transporter [Corynebacterium cystitidis DSM 20524]SNV81713.1 Choline-glycine betaine transporter [Corynebacterium cystitidis]
MGQPVHSGPQAIGLVDETTNWLLVAIIGLLTICFLASAMSGVGKGIQYLSNFNMFIAAILAIFLRIRCWADPVHREPHPGFLRCLL